LLLGLRTSPEAVPPRLSAGPTIIVIRIVQERTIDIIDAEAETDTASLRRNRQNLRAPLPLLRRA